MHTYARYTLTLLFVLSAVFTGTMPVAAQPKDADTTYVSELTGATLDLGDSGDWEIVSVELFPADERGYVEEQIRIHSDTGVLGIQINDSSFTPSSWTDATLSKYVEDYNWGEVLVRSETSSSGYMLFRGAPVLDISRVFYSEFQTYASANMSMAVGLYSNEESFLSDLESVRSNVTLDGKPLFADTDGPEIEAMLNGTSDTTPEPLAFNHTTVGDWNDFGLVSETEWQSPDTGTVVTWDDELVFPFHNLTGISYDADAAQHTLRLTTPDFKGQVTISSTENSLDFTLNDLSEFLTSDEYKDETMPGSEIMGVSESGNALSIVYVGVPQFGHERIVVRHYIFDKNGNLVLLSIEALSRDIEHIYHDAIGAVSVDGQSVEPAWAPNEINSLLQSPNTEAGNDTEITRTSRGSSDDTSSSETPAVTGGETVVAESSGATIDLGPTGEAFFLDDEFSTTEASGYTLETITIQYGTTIIIVDIMDGDVLVDDYMLQSESDIAATYDYTDWLGGEWSNNHAWDAYSGVYKLDYREHVYLDFVYDPETDLYYGIGVYSSSEDLPSDIEWIQNNITIEGQGIFANADADQIESVIAGDSRFESESVPVPLATVEDWSDAGLVSETEWQSPFTTTSFTWDGTEIVFPFAQTDALDATDGVTTLELRTSDRRGEIKLSTAEVDFVPADWVDNYTSEEFLDSQEAIGQPVTIVDSSIQEETGSVIQYYETDFGDPVVVIMDVYVNSDGVTILTEIAASPEDIADVYATFWDSVQSNGDFYPLTWSLDDIKNLEID